MKTIFFNSVFRKAIGLMFRKAKDNTLYVFVFKRAVDYGFHMNFVFHPIDIFFLDQEKRIVDYKINFKPWTNYKSKKRFHYAIETKRGLLKKKLGEEISF